MERKTVHYLVQAGLIAAIYYVLTVVFGFMGYGVIQFRLSEILVILPIFTPAAIPGLTLGCFLANLGSPLGMFDYVFGTLATLLAALFTYYVFKKIKNYWIAMLGPVMINALIVGYILTITIAPEAPVYINMLYVGISELIIVYFGGTILKAALQKTKAVSRIFK